MTRDVCIEVAFALPAVQELVEMRVPEGTTVAGAVEASGLVERYPEHALAALEVGIWGRVVDRDRVVVPGDRVEIYRPLVIDPREARRKLALAGKTMRQAPRSN